MDFRPKDRVPFIVEGYKSDIFILIDDLLYYVSRYMTDSYGTFDDLKHTLSQFRPNDKLTNLNRFTLHTHHATSQFKTFCNSKQIYIDGFNKP